MLIVTSWVCERESLSQTKHKLGLIWDAFSIKVPLNFLQLHPFLVEKKKEQLSTAKIIQ